MRSPVVHCVSVQVFFILIGFLAVKGVLSMGGSDPHTVAYSNRDRENPSTPHYDHDHRQFRPWRRRQRNETIGVGFNFTPNWLVTIITRTQTILSTTIETLSSVALCAKLVNVTGPCRLRRGYWAEEPIVLTFDEDMEFLDGALMTPANVLGIEPTVLPQPNQVDGTAGPSDDTVIEPSSSDEAARRQWGYTTPFNVLKNMYAAYHWMRRNWSYQPIKIVTTSVHTSTVTSQSYIAVSTKTFFVQRCSPSPFPFTICPRFKK